MTTTSTIPERGVAGLASLFDGFGVGIYCLDLEGRVTYLNPAGQALLGWDADELLGEHAHDCFHHSRPDGSTLPRERCPFYRAVRRGATRREHDDVFWTRAGAALPVVYTLAPLHDEVGAHVGAIVVFADESERRRDAELLRARTAQQAGLAELGLRALGGDALPELLQDASAVVARLLDVELAQVLQLTDENPDALRLVAGVGWRPGVAGAAQVGLDRDSPAGVALACDRPLVVDDWRTDTRLRAPALLREHDVRSSASVVIHGRDHPWGTAPWGVVGAHSTRPRTFTDEDVAFLQSVASTLALAIERHDAEHELRRRNAEISELAGEVTTLADDRRRIMADALDAEDRAREQISQMLHDEVLQSLLAARQDLATATRAGSSRGDAVARARAAVTQAIGELRSAVVALHPVMLSQGGLAAAIEATADVYGRRGGFGVTLHVAPEAIGVRDQLLLSLARELLSNVAQHASARHVSISLCRADGHVVFEIADDGHGMDPAEPVDALRRGHVGLASVAMRVEACGGRVELASDRGQGTRVQVTLPAGGAADAR